MKNDQLLLKVLKKELDLMALAAKALKRSWEDCQIINYKSNLSMEELDRLELLSSRFSRFTDFMIQRIFRLIDVIDLESSGTVRDTINRAEKKGLTDSADAFIQARILRNKIAHEYVEKVMKEIFEETIRLTPTLLNSVTLTNSYTRKYLSTE